MLFVAIALLLPFLGSSQEQSTIKDSVKVYDLDEVVVSPTKTSRPVIEVPMRVQAVPTHVIKSGSYFSIDDVLKPISGVTVSRGMSFLDRKSTVSMRGMGSDQGRTLILLNGIPINKASSGSVNFNMLNLSNIARVEVVKGPGSSIYGGNSMGGTINFITREPQRRIEGNISADYGTFNTVGSSVNIGSRLGNFYLGVNAFARSSDGYNAVPEEEQSINTINSPLRESGIGGVIGYYLNPTDKIEFTTTYYNGLRSRGERLFILDDEKDEVVDIVNADVIYNSSTYNLKYNGTKGHFTWEANAFLSLEDYTEVRFKGSDVYDVKVDRRDWGVWFNQNYSGFKNQTLTAGIEYKGGYVDGRDEYRTSTDVIINKGQSNALALYIQDEIRFGRFMLIPALRFDYARFGKGGFFIENPTSVSEYLGGETGSLPNENWTSLNPRLAAQYMIGKKSRIYVNLGTGFRPGSLEDMCRTGPISGGVVKANPKLKPEHLVNYELGADFTITRDLIISSSVYYSLGRNFIYTVNTGETILMGKRERPLLAQSNIGKVEIKGMEVDINYYMNQYLSLFANCTYTSSKVKEFYDPEDPSKELKGKYLTYVPKYQASAGGNFKAGPFNLSLLYRYLTKQYTTDSNDEDDVIPNYGQFDAKVWALLSNNATLSFGVNNVFDKRVRDSNDNISMGRYFYTKVTFSF